MRIINIFGGPGAGKSTTAAGLFYQMKIRRLEVELVTEYAKDMTWEGRTNILTDQLYVLAKQNRRLHRLRDHHVDWVVSDSPLVLGLVYQPPEYFNYFQPLLLEVFNSYDNVNIMLERAFEYNPIGRNQTAVEAVEVDNRLKETLDRIRVKYHTIGNDPGLDRIDEILRIINL